MSTVKIHIKDDIYTVVDTDIAEKIKNKNIYLRSIDKPYVCFWQNRKHVFLHRFVMNAKEGQITDHINKNKLDNRRCNLRFVTSSQSSLNRTLKKIPASKYNRVYELKSKKKFRARLRPMSGNIEVGRFFSRHIAAFFADSAARKIYDIKPAFNFSSRIKRRHLVRVLERTKGRIFGVVFVKRSDGTERNMSCRINVKKNVKGTGLLFEPEHMNLLPVYDVMKKDYRFIPIENVLCLTFKKKRYRVN